jgi:hypothetical protein
VDLGRAIELEILDVVGEQRFVIALTADEMRKLSNQEK